MLLARQFIQHIAHLVIAAALNRLLAAEDLFDSRTQSFGAVDDKQVLAIAGQSLREA